MGIDYGGRRVGIAVSESGVLASPHSVIANDERMLDRLARVAEDVEADTIVVGVARRSRSTAGEAKFLRFAEQLRKKTCRSVVLWDESYSTVEAAERLRDSRRKSKDDIDMYAAAIILQSYLDHLAGRSS
jgi:putative transcription antitermination factor YqgF